MKTIPLSTTYSGMLTDRIRRCHLFGPLSIEERESILSHSRVARLAQDEVFFQQGQAAEEFFLLDTGQVKLSLMSADGHEKVLDLINAGQTFAEAIIFSGGEGFPVTCVALEASHVICFDAQHYMALLRTNRDACFALLARMSQRLHFQVMEIDRLTLHSATYRLIHYLLEQIPSTQFGAPEVRLNTAKHVIASRLAISPETLSRILKRLSNQGLIEVHDAAIIITDVGKARQYISQELV